MKNLKITFVLFSMILVLSSCKVQTEKTDDPTVRASCTLMGSMTVVTAKIKSLTPIPPNVRFLINNTNFSADECGSTDLFNSSVKVNESRTEADVTFFFDNSDELIYYYFPNGTDNDPQDNKMSLYIQSRNDCKDNPTDILGIDNITINWKKVYANGKSCGVTSHSGDSELELSFDN